MRAPIVTLLTDFGTKDSYVASMKGVILTINPRCRLVDISHEVSAHDVEEGAYILLQAFSSFPEGTIHLGVVDPEVGGPRKPILVVTEHYFFVGPDNGLFAFVLRREKPEKVIHLTNTKYFLPRVSGTFHGRDIFAPVAGYLSRGVLPKAFGKPTDRWETLGFQGPLLNGDRLMGRIVYIDRFGNLVSNISEAELRDFVGDRPFWVTVKGQRIEGLKRGYWEAKKKGALALIGSGGFLEVAIREGNAAKNFKAKKGDRLTIKIPPMKGKPN